MDQNVFKTNMAALGEYFDKQASEALIRIYWRALKHLSDEQFIAAIDACISNCKWFPKVTEILDFAPKLKQLENKGSLSWCENTQNLVDIYGGQYE